jgi:hypothetical protein
VSAPFFRDAVHYDRSAAREEMIRSSLEKRPFPSINLVNSSATGHGGVDRPVGGRPASMLWKGSAFSSIEVGGGCPARGDKQPAGRRLSATAQQRRPAFGDESMMLPATTEGDPLF